MKYKIFPKSNFEISVLGFGTAPIGLSGYQDKSFNQKQEEKNSIKALETAIDLGVNFFDTAPVYGNKIEGCRWTKDRASEKMLGIVLSKVRREKIFIATKNYIGENDEKKIRESLNESLRLLKTDYVDLLHMHGQSYRADNWQNFITDEVIKTLQSLKKEGKIRFIGASGYRESGFCPMIECGIVDAIMPQYNIFFRSAEFELLKLAQENNVAVFPMKPATGKEISKFIKEIDPEKKLQIDPYKIAIKYILGNPSITSIPVGMRTEKEVKHNVEIIEELELVF